MPPGRSTRKISPTAFGVSGLWWITPQEYTTSNVLSGNRRCSASPIREVAPRSPSARLEPPRRHILHRAPGVRSMPVRMAARFGKTLMIGAEADVDILEHTRLPRVLSPKRAKSAYVGLERVARLRPGRDSRARSRFGDKVTRRTPRVPESWTPRLALESHDPISVHRRCSRPAAMRCDACGTESRKCRHQISMPINTSIGYAASTRPHVIGNQCGDSRRVEEAPALDRGTQHVIDQLPQIVLQPAP